MHATPGNLFTRDDTMLGVCEALGEDLGFNPLYLRMALGVLLIWQPVAVVSAYVAAGIVVLASRLLFPSKRMAGQEQPQADAEPVARMPVATDGGMTAEYDDRDQPLLIAA